MPVKYRWSTMPDLDYPLAPTITDPSTDADEHKDKPPFQVIAQWHGDEEVDLFGDESLPVAVIIDKGSSGWTSTW